MHEVNTLLQFSKVLGNFVLMCNQHKKSNEWQNSKESWGCTF